ncbi:MAG: CARDB domain-containing protein, partial [Bradymonadaceae bacterium]
RCYDPFTPNATFNDAHSIGDGSYSNLVVCADSPDYYEICVEHGKRLTATVNFADADGDIDLEIFDQHRRPLATSANSGVDTEQVSVDYVNGDQCYYLHVYLLSNDAQAQNSYNLDIAISEVDESLQCSGAFEPNNGFETASSLVAAINHTQLLDRCPVGDVDFFYVYMTIGQKVTFHADLEPTNQPGTLRLQLYRPSQTPVANAETAPGVPGVSITYTAASTGRHYIQLTIGGTARRVTYNLDADGLRGIDLTPTNFVIGPGSYEAEAEVRFGFDLTNLGPDSATTPTYHLYLGTSSTLDTNSDVLLGSYVAPTVAGNATVAVEDKANLPETITAGTNYLHIVVDPDDELEDTNPANNTTSRTIELVQ